MNASLLSSEVVDRVALLTLNQPEKRNVLSTAMLTALDDRLDWAGASPEIRAVVLRGSGPGFCAGHDLRELESCNSDQAERLFSLCSRVMEKIRTLPKPVIAQVHGVATAAGCQLVATCDLAVASVDATFATPGVKIGLFCSTPAVAVTRAVPLKRAMEMLLTGEPMGAQEALASGLVNRVVAREDLEKETMGLAKRIIAYSGATLAMGKQAMYAQLSMSRPDAYALAERVMVANTLARDGREGISAFLQKRPPVWSDAEPPTGTS